MKNWIVPAAIVGVVAWVWFKGKKTQASPLPIKTNPVVIPNTNTSGSGALPPSPGYVLVKNKFTGQTTWVFNSSLSAYLAGDWVLA